MKTLLISAAAAVALTGPVFADTADFARQHFAQSHEVGDGPRTIGETSSGDVNAAIALFQDSRETGDGPRIRSVASDAMVVSTSNSDLASFASAQLGNDLRGDN
jgi:hypothetical protein